MRLTQISTTASAPEYVFGVFWTDGTIRNLIYSSTLHRDCINWLAKQSNAESYKIARRVARGFAWDFAWHDK